MARRIERGRRLELEALEDRTLPARNVTATLAGDTLLIRGDGPSGNRTFVAAPERKGE